MQVSKHALLAITCLSTVGANVGGGASGGGAAGGGNYNYYGGGGGGGQPQQYQQQGYNPYQQQQQQQQQQGYNPRYESGYYPNSYQQQQQQPQQPQAPVEQEPEALPSGWVELTDPNSGRSYYYNSSEGMTQWERPVAVKEVEKEEEEVPVVPGTEETQGDGDEQVLAGGESEVVSEPSVKDEMQTPMSDGSGDEGPLKMQADGLQQQHSLMSETPSLPAEEKSSEGGEEAIDPTRRAYEEMYGTPFPQQQQQQQQQTSSQPQHPGWGMQARPAQRQQQFSHPQWRQEEQFGRNSTEVGGYSSQDQQKTSSGEYGVPPKAVQQPQRPEKNDQQPSQQQGRSNVYGDKYPDANMMPQQAGPPKQQQPPKQPQAQYPPNQGNSYQQQAQRQHQYPPNQNNPYPHQYPGQYHQSQNGYNPYQQHQQQYGGYNNPNGNYGGYNYNSGQMVQNQPQNNAMKDALSSAWQGVLGFGNRTKTAAATAVGTVAAGATAAGQAVGGTASGLVGKAKDVSEQLSKGIFEGGGNNQRGQGGYSLSSYGAPPVPGQNQGPYGQQGYPGAGYGGYPQPRGNVPYPHQQQQQYQYPPNHPSQQQGPQQGPPHHTQWSQHQNQQGPQQQKSAPQQQQRPPQQQNDGRYPPQQHQGGGYRGYPPQQNQYQDPSSHPGWNSN